MGCCLNRTTIPSSEEKIIKLISNLRLSSYTFEEMFNELNKYSINGKIPKSKVVSEVLSPKNSNFSRIKEFEKNLFLFITNYFANNSMNLSEYMFFIYIFLNKGNDISQANKKLYKIFCEVTVGTLTKEKLMKLINDYIFFFTYRLNFFLESIEFTNDEDIRNPVDFKNDLSTFNEKIFTNKNISNIVDRLFKLIEGKYSIVKNTEITLEMFEDLVSTINLNSFIDMRSMMFETYDV